MRNTCNEKPRHGFGGFQRLLFVSLIIYIHILYNMYGKSTYQCKHIDMTGLKMRFGASVSLEDDGEDDGEQLKKSGC